MLANFQKSQNIQEVKLIDEVIMAYGTKYIRVRNFAHFRA